MSISGKLTVMAATAAVVGALTVAGGSAQAQSFDEFKPKSAGDFVIRARGIAMVPDESTSTSDIATA